VDKFDFVMNYLNPIVDRYLAEGKSSIEVEERELMGVWIADAEINNGGFDQFYWNSTGDLALEAVEGFELIGANEKSSIIDTANREFPNGKPDENRSIRQSQLEDVRHSIASRLRSLDDAYYKSSGDVIELLASYIESKVSD